LPTGKFLRGFRDLGFQYQQENFEFWAASTLTTKL